MATGRQLMPAGSLYLKIVILISILLHNCIFNEKITGTILSFLRVVVV